MTHRDDLAPFDEDADSALVAVGWLARGMPYPQGASPSPFVERLRGLLVDPWQPHVSTGLHSCDLCQFDGPRSSGELYVPHDGVIYVAPCGILHVMAAH